MANPPTRLKAAIIKAIEPMICSVRVEEIEKRIKTPNIVTAEMAFVMDIKGVWSNVGILEIRKYPTIKENRKTPAINKRFAIGLLLEYFHDHFSP